MDLLSGVFDISYLRKKGCEGINDNKKRFRNILTQILKNIIIFLIQEQSIGT